MTQTIRVNIKQLLERHEPVRDEGEKVWAISRKSWGMLIDIPSFAPYDLTHAFDLALGAR